MRAAIYTLGCKVNQYETQAMEQELRRLARRIIWRDFLSLTAVTEQVLMM